MQFLNDIIMLKIHGFTSLYLSVDGHLDRFPFLTVMNNATVDICIHVFI